jgi:glyoxylase-like metal-dependent hydrolase (beta-lactamase superfamily II)
MSKASEQAKRFFRGAMASINPYIKLGKFKPFEGDSDFMPGFKGISTPGHTPGHTSYVAQSKGQRMVF